MKFIGLMCVCVNITFCVLYMQNMVSVQSSLLYKELYFSVFVDFTYINVCIFVCYMC